MANKKYELGIYGREEKKSDCDVMLNDVENVFGSLGNCIDSAFDTAFDEKQSKMQVVGSIFGIGKAATKLLWNGTGCAVKHTPKAIVTAAKYKREFVDSVTEEISKVQKQMKEDELDEKIKRLTVNKKEISL